MRWRVRVYWEPRDCWIGVYWDRKPTHDIRKLFVWDVYICLVPCIPIRIYQELLYTVTTGTVKS